MSDADIVSVFARKMGSVERLMQRTNTDVQVSSSGDMKELHNRITDVAAQIKREKYIEQLEAIEIRTRSPLKVLPLLCDRRLLEHEESGRERATSSHSVPQFK
jgi:hypothetical protein